MQIGLKGFWKNHKESSLKWILKDLRWELRYAFRRAWCGYDDYDVFDLGFRFMERMPVLLREFKKYNNGMWYDSETDKQLNEEETDAVIDSLIRGFELCNEDTFMKQPHIKSLDIRDQYRLFREHQQDTLQLFAKWCTSLWY